MTHIILFLVLIALLLVLGFREILLKRTKRALLFLLVIFALLLLLLANLVNPCCYSPPLSEILADTLKGAVNSPGIMKSANTVIAFRPDAPVFTSEAVAEIAKVGLEPEQICISSGEFMEDTEILAPGESGSDTTKNWEAFEDGSMIRYRGSTTKNVNIVVVCHSTATKLLNTIEKYLEPDIKVGWMDGSQGEPASSFKCRCLEDELYKNRECCLVALRFVR
jgi:energy-coupling factor transporter transmembrane protein EcfT